MMKDSWVLCIALAVFWGANLGRAFYGLDQDHDHEKVLVDNKCQCVKVTSKFVASKDDPDNEVLSAPHSQENISDPTSPVRTKFVYSLSKLCGNCHSGDNPEKGQRVGESGLCNDPQEPCYTYDRNKCYTAPCQFNNGGKTQTIETALTPESCFDD